MVDRRDPADPSTLTISNVLESRLDATSRRFEANMRAMADLMATVHNEEEKIREGGGPNAIENRIPTIYLVDSAGVFLPLQEDVFPDTDDFGRVFRNNAVMSALGIPQIAAIMGMCVAGGGYLPVMCDHVLMTDGSGLFLAGPALVQAAIGQKYSAEELGGAAMHSAISGTADFREPNDEACIARIRSIVEKWGYRRQSPWDRKKPVKPEY